MIFIIIRDYLKKGIINIKIKLFKYYENSGKFKLTMHK